MKRILYILLVTLSICLCSEKLWALSAPVLHCLEVQTDGSVHVIWDRPTDVANFRFYILYFSYDGVRFDIVDTIRVTDPSNPDRGGWPHNNVNAVNDVIYYYVAAISNTGHPYRSNILHTMKLELSNPDDGYAHLEWDTPCDTLLPSYYDQYYIYRRLQGEAAFSKIDFTRDRSYKDEIIVCRQNIEYKVVLEDLSRNCNNVSPVSKDTFTDKIYPEIPLLDSVSVNFHTGYTHIGWSRSTSIDVSSYIIYCYINNMWINVDTIKGYYNTKYVDSLRDPSINDYHYCIAAMDNCRPSNMGNEQKTMRITGVEPNTCRQEAKISWTPYINMRDGLKEYGIYCSVDGGTLKLVGTVASTITQYTLTGLALNKKYKVAVKAHSNNNRIKTMSAATEFNLEGESLSHLAYITSVSVEDNDNSAIVINCLTSGDTLPFAKLLLYRSINGISDFSEITTLYYQNGIAEYLYTDYDVSVDDTYYFYKIELYDECDELRTTSNISSNILLKPIVSGTSNNTMEWLGYKEWTNGVSNYQLYRKFEIESFFDELKIVSPSTHNIFQDDVSEYGAYGSEFTYYLTAYSKPDSYGRVYESNSNSVVFKQSPTLYLPNAFCPHGINREFKPVNSFVSSQNYSFSIYNRFGQLIFTTNDPYAGWDGTHNEKMSPMGVYTYLIKYQDADGERYEKTGTVTLVMH